jgi:hypothetical protein
MAGLRIAWSAACVAFLGAEGKTAEQARRYMSGYADGDTHRNLPSQRGKVSRSAAPSWARGSSQCPTPSAAPAGCG